jgi:HK97 family phage prohead protease
MKRSEREIRTMCREVRAAPAEDGKLRFEGYAAVFNEYSEDLGGFREIILPGAFKDALGGDVRCLMNHDPNYVLGRPKSGTLQLDEDERGLHFIVTAPDAAWARDLYLSVERGDIDQCSFAFSVNEGGEVWRKTDGGAERVLVSLSLYDVSIVTYPAYPGTQAKVRSAEEVLRDHPRGWGRTEILRKKLDLRNGGKNYE